MYPPPSKDTEYQHFLDTVVQNQTVYTLVDDNGIAECPSTEYNNAEGEPVAVLCYWTSAEAAQACRQEEWAEYRLEAVPLGEFMRTWLINMDEDECLAGIEFDPRLYGLEIEPVELLGNLMDTAERLGIHLDIPDYEELVAYRLEWDRMAAGQTLLN